MGTEMETNMTNKWVKNSREDFMKGSFGNGGQNLYVSAGGVLQRIYQYDVNGDGYPDLTFVNSQSMGERPPVHIYGAPLSSDEYAALPVNGGFDGIFADLTGDGCEDLIVACQHDGVHNDVTACIYFGSELGLSEKYKMELPAPNAIGVAAGSFRGNGKNDLVFICGETLRIFYQTALGIEACRFAEFPLGALSIAAGDLDGDGYDDLYVLLANGSTRVYWGGEKGLDPSVFTEVGGEMPVVSNDITTTAGRKPIHMRWRASVVQFGGGKRIFRADEDNAFIEGFTPERKRETLFMLACKNVSSVAVGDLNGDGTPDIAVAVCADRDDAEESFVLWGADGYAFEKATRFTTRSARFASISRLDGTGKEYLLLCQGGTRALNSTCSKIYGFDGEGKIRVERTLPSENAARLIAGRTSPDGVMQLAVINHESGRIRGDENVCIYLGGEDGYREDRKVELPGWSAVDSCIFDFNDDGLPDVLVVNCAENAPHMDPGSFIYINSASGFDPGRRIVLPSIMGHGSAVGDFRKSGYLDVAIGGIHNREIRIFEGGPNGYDADSPKRVVLGPNPEGFTPFVCKTEEEESPYTDEERAILKDFGGVRWLFTADFNGDGWLDLFISEIHGPNCFILWGGPDGFSASNCQALATDGASGCNAADLNGNGYLDLIIASYQSTQKKTRMESYITIYWGGPDGYRENRKTQLPTYCSNSIAVGDYNSDGLLDIYATTYNNGRTRDLYSFLYLNSPDGIFRKDDHRLLFNHSGSGCLSGDFNGDGYTDLAVACHKGYGDHVYKSRIFWGGPDGLSDDRITELPTKGPHGMTVVDIGNIMDRGDEEYYYSEAYRIPEGARGIKAHWDAELGIKNWVNMQVRLGESEKDLESKPWTDLYATPGTDAQKALGMDPCATPGTDAQKAPGTDAQKALGMDFPQPAPAYMQYRLALGAKCGCGTPRVSSVTVEFQSNQI